MSDKKKIKIVKIVLGIVIALSIAFFALGIIIQELNYVSTITIKQPISKVFELFNNNEKISEWIPEIQSIESVTKTDNIKGSTFKITINNGGNKILLEEKILDFVKNEKILLFFRGGGMLKKDCYLFENKKNTSTLITLKTNIRSEGFMLGCILPLVKSKLQDQDQQYLNNFKKFAENSK